MSVIKEFKEFAMRGNVIDLAVGVVIGGAFGKIVTSLVSDILMPVIGLVMGGIDFKSMKYVFAPEVKDAAGAVTTPESALNYGMFIQNIVDFLIIAFCIFMIIRAMNKLRKPEEAPAPAGPTQEDLLTEIRDLLKK